MNKLLSSFISWFKKPIYNDLGRDEACSIIERFVGRSSHDDYEWRDFLDHESRDPNIEKARREIVEIAASHYSGGKYGFCDPEGIKKIVAIAKTLRQHSE